MPVPEAVVRLGVRDKTKAGTNSAKRNMVSLQAVALKLTGVLAALGGAAGMGRLVKGAIDAGDRVQKLAISTGISTEALSELRHVAGITGTEFEVIVKSISKLQKATGDASDGLKTYVDMFDKAGINLEEFKQLEPDQQFEAIGEALSKMTNQADKTQVAMGLLGRGGVDLIRVFENGAEGVRELREEAKELGLSLSRDQVDKMAAANDAMLRLKSVSNALGNELAVNLAPVIIDVANAIRNEIPGAVEIADDALDWLQDTFNDLGGTIMNMIEVAFTAMAKWPGFTDTMKQSFEDIAYHAREVQDSMAANREEFEKDEEVVASYTRSIGTLADEFEAVFTPAVEGATDALNEFTTTQSWFNDLQKEAEAVISQIQTPMEEYTNRVALLQDMLAEELLTQDQFNLALKDAESILKDATEQTKEAEKAMASFEGMASDALTDLTAGGRDFNDVLKDIAAQLIEMGVKKLFENAFGGGSSGGFGLGSLFSGLGSLFGIGGSGGSAAGSIGTGMGFSIPSFDKGTDYVQQDTLAFVHKGERIIPSGRNGGTNIELNINVQGNADANTVEIVRQIAKDEIVPQAVKASMEGTMASLHRRGFG